MRTAIAACALVLGLMPLAAAYAQSPPVPTTTRQVVLEKGENGYRWKLAEASVPAPGERQVKFLAGFFRRRCRCSSGQFTLLPTARLGRFRFQFFSRTLIVHFATET